MNSIWLRLKNISGRNDDFNNEDEDLGFEYCK